MFPLLAFLTGTHILSAIFSTILRIFLWRRIIIDFILDLVIELLLMKKEIMIKKFEEITIIKSILK